MIGTIDIKINAAKPNFPLAPLFAFVNSPSQVRVINAPKAIGNWKITKVYVTANYPDNQSASVEATLVGGCWSATLPASTATGTSTNGFTITADGVKEDGSTAVTGYVLGKGDVTILDTDGTITTGETTYYLHILDAQPTTPKKGDICIIGGVWKIYNGTAWVALGGGGGDVAHSDFAAVDAVGDRFTINDLKGKVNEVLGILKGTAAIAFMAALPLFGGVETAQLGALYNDSLVVTNVTDIGLDTNAVNALIAPATNGAVLASVAAVTNRAAKTAGGNVKIGAPENMIIENPWWDTLVENWKCYGNFEGESLSYLFVGGNSENNPFGFYQSEDMSYSFTYAHIDEVTTNTLGLVSYGELDAATNAVSAAVTNAIGDLPATVATWENYWRGDRVRLSVTNYYGNTSGEPPRLRIEESQTNALGVVTNWVQVWDEVTRQTNYYNAVNEKVDNISNSVMTAAFIQTQTQIANKAPRAWGTVTSAGTKAPDNTVWHTAPKTVFAGGTEYAHVAVADGSISILTDVGASVYTSGDTGTFKFSDDTGSNFFGFDVRGKYELGARADGIVVTNNICSIEYEVVANTAPILMCSTNLVDWADVDSTEVTWDTSSTPGLMTAFLNVTGKKQGYYKAEYRYAASAKFTTNMPADFSGGILATNESGQTTASQLSIYPVVTTTGVIWRVQWGE